MSVAETEGIGEEGEFVPTCQPTDSLALLKRSFLFFSFALDFVVRVNIDILECTYFVCLGDGQGWWSF